MRIAAFEAAHDKTKMEGLYMVCTSPQNDVGHPFDAYVLSFFAPVLFALANISLIAQLRHLLSF